MKPTARRLSFPFAAAFAALLAPPALHAATFYWDANGATGGFGNATGGAWSEDDTSASSPGSGRWTQGTGADLGTVAGNPLQVTANTDTFNFGTATLGLTAGTINVTGTVNMGSTTFGAASGAIVLTGGTIAYSAAPTVTVNNPTNTITSIVGGAATSFTKAGNGILILNGANTYTGSTIINAGTIDLGGGTGTGLLNSTVLTLGGGSFNYTHTGSTTQNFTTTNINSAASTISVVSGNTLNLGTVTRGTGIRFDFSSTGAGTLAAATASNVGGIMSGFTLGDSWAVATGTTSAITALGSYTLTSAAGTTAANYTGFNIDADSSAGALSAAITANSLRFSAAAANTVTLTGTTNVITTGGILVGSAVGSNLSTITGGTLAGANAKDLSVIQNNTSGGLTISSIIADDTGATALVKAGAGLLTLGGNNTFTGGLSIYAGTVVLANAGALRSNVGTENAVSFGAGSTSTLTLGGNSVVVRSLSGSSGTIVENANATPATLTIGNSGNAASTWSGLIRDGTGGGALTLAKSGTGKLDLYSANTYIGGTTINAGTIEINNAGSFGGTGIITFAGNGTIQPVHSSNPTLANGIQVNPSVTGTLYVDNQFFNMTYSGPVTGSGTLVQLNGGGGATGTVTLSSAANTFTGILQLAAPNGKTSSLTVNSLADSANRIRFTTSFGVAATGNNFTLGAGAATPLLFNSRQIELASTTGTAGIYNNNGTATNTITINTNLLITANGAKTLLLGGSNIGANTFAGTIGNSGAGATSFTKADGGRWILSNTASTYTGTTTISGGILEVTKLDIGGNNSSIGASGAGAGNLILNGGTLRYTGAAASTDRLFSLQANGGIDSSGTGAVNFSNTGAMGFNGGVAAKTLTLTGTNTGDNTLAAVIGNNTAATSIAKTGIGTWVLSGTNSATGTTNLSGGGTLILDYTTNNNAKLGSGALTLTSGGNLILRAGSAFTQSVGSLTLGTGTSGGNTSISRDSGGINKIALGAITRSASQYATLFLAEDNLATTASANVNGVLTGGITVGSNWAKNDGANNIVGLSGIGVGNYTDLSITAGGTSGAPLNNNYQLTGNKTATGEFVLGSLRIVNSASNDTLNMAGFQLRVSPLTGTLGNGAGGGILYVGDDGASTTNNTYTITGASGLQAQNGNQELIINTFRGTLNIAVPLTMGSQGVAKTGAGKLTLSGASTYTGPTFVNQGTLLANNTTGNGIGTGAVTVHRGAALGGTGTVGGSTTIAAGGGLTFDLITAPGSHDKLELAATKALTFSGTSTLTVTSSGGTPGTGTYTLLTAPGGIAGSVPTVSLPGGWTGTASIAGNDLLLNVTSVGGGGPGPVDHFDISAISSPQTVGTPITGIILTAKDASNVTATGFTGTVTFGGTGGFTGTSASFVLGVLSGVSVTPTVAGSNLTFTVADGATHTGSTTITTIQTQYVGWSGASDFDVDTNGDGVKNGLAFLLGAANKTDSALNLLPKVSQSGGNLILDFTCLKVARRGTSVLKLQHSKDLGIGDAWTVDEVAVPDTAGVAGITDVVTFTVPTVNANPNLVDLRATIPAGAAALGSKLFGRLHGNNP